MTLRRMIAWITILAIFAMAARISVDTDTWWHLRAGQWIIENRSIPQTDPFSHTRAGAEWQYPGWLVEVLMYLIFNLFGAGGLNLWTAFMVALTFVFTWHTMSGGPFFRAFIIVLAGAVTAVYWAARPYLVTFLFTAIFYWVLEIDSSKPGQYAVRKLWLLPILMIVWANSHGGFIIGFLVWGVYVFDLLWSWVKSRSVLNKVSNIFRNPRESLFHHEYRLIWLGFMLILAVCVNPSGPVMLLYPFKTISIGALQDYIQEWQSPNFHNISVQPFIWLLILVIGVLGASRKRLTLTDFLFLAGFTYLGLLAGRNIALFGLVTAPIITHYGAPLLELIGRRLGIRINTDRKLSTHSKALRFRSILNIFLLFLILVAVILKLSLIVPVEPNKTYFKNSMPVDAVNFIKLEQPAGKLFNSYNWGGYILWALQEYPVFIDGRTDLYDDEVINKWLQIIRADADWENLLDSYSIGVILIEINSPLDRSLGMSPNWQKTYTDTLAVVYQRKAP